MAGENLINAGDYSARRYAEFFDSLPAPIFRTTIEGKIVYCNYAFADLFGFDSALDLIDYPVIEFYRNKKDRGNLIHTVMQTGRINDLPVALRKKDGTPIWCAITAKAILDDDGIAINVDGILKEITSDIDLDTKVPKNEKFQGVLEMAGGVAHRLNQPLTIINNLINEILSGLQKDNRFYPKIVKVHNQIKKMNDITDKLGRIRKYESMDYVAGIKIVDIEKASWSRESEDDR
jgi:PAS domain S-box-containing protein